jgi:hypothetical protein
MACTHYANCLPHPSLTIALLSVMEEIHQITLLLLHNHLSRRHTSRLACCSPMIWSPSLASRSGLVDQFRMKDHAADRITPPPSTVSSQSSQISLLMR